MITKLNSLSIFLMKNSFEREAEQLNLLKKALTAKPRPIGTAPARILTPEERAREFFEQDHGYDFGFDESRMQELMSPESIENEKIKEYLDIINLIKSYPEGKAGYEITVFDEIIDDIMGVEESVESEMSNSGVEVERGNAEEGMSALEEGTLFQNDNDDGMLDGISEEDAIRKILESVKGPEGETFSEEDIEILLKESSNLISLSPSKARELISEAGLWDDMVDGAKAVGGAVADGAKWVGKTAWKGLSVAGRGLMRALPWIGLLITIPTLVKNFIEAVNNGKAILSELPLSKYGLSKTIIFNPVGLKDKLKTAVNNHRGSPESLRELLKITNVVEKYYVDFMKIITNVFFLILDLAAFAAVAAAPIPIIGWTAALGGTALQIGLSLGLVGIELGAEYYSSRHWGEVYTAVIAACTLGISEERGAVLDEGWDKFITNKDDFFKEEAENFVAAASLSVSTRRKISCRDTKA